MLLLLLLLLLLLMMMMVVVVVMMMMMMMMMMTTLLICDHPGVPGACNMNSIFLILSRAPVNRGLPSIAGADNARWHTPRPIVRARWILVLWPPGLEVASRTSRTTLLALQVSAEQSVGWMTAMPSSPPIRPTVFRSGRREAAKTLTGDCSALYWTQELGLTCLESGRRAASNEPSYFSRR